MGSDSRSTPLPFAHWLFASGEAANTVEERVIALFEELREPLFRYLLVTLRNAADAEDVTQECFLRLYLELRSSVAIEKTKSWLFQTGHNLAVDRRRQSENRVVDSLDLATASLIGDRRPSSEDDLLHRERLEWMRSAIDGLSTQQRLCLHLRTEGFRYREIAEILHLHESTVCENIRRGLARITRESHGH